MQLEFRVPIMVSLLGDNNHPHRVPRGPRVLIGVARMARITSRGFADGVTAAPKLPSPPALDFAARSFSALLIARKKDFPYHEENLCFTWKPP